MPKRSGISTSDLPLAVALHVLGRRHRLVHPPVSTLASLHPHVSRGPSAKGTVRLSESWGVNTERARRVKALRAVLNHAYTYASAAHFSAYSNNINFIIIHLIYIYVTKSASKSHIQMTAFGLPLEGDSPPIALRFRSDVTLICLSRRTTHSATVRGCHMTHHGGSTCAGRPSTA